MPGASLKVMAFEPDILVTSADGSEIMLVAETKWHDRDVPNAEGQLKAYMTGMGARAYRVADYTSAVAHLSGSVLGAAWDLD